jgi:UDP-N-acetylmuramoylalanine--D-glutamate ligase
MPAPLISLAGKTDPDSVTVVELSSYQLETVDTFHPAVAALLNMSPDHLDRYPSLDAYYEAKTRIAMNQGEKDVLVVNGDDPEVMRRTSSVSSRRWIFSMNEGDDVRAWIGENLIYCLYKNSEVEILPVDELPILGPHNLLNVLASLCMVLAVVELRGDSLSLERVRSALKSFQGLPHRMEKVGEVKGRIFINDSKATTVSAASMALQGLENVILLAGGQTKGDDYTRLVSSMKGRVRTVVLMGDEQEHFREVFSSFNTLSSSGMEDAVRLAFDVSRSGDAILLSPACASFDWYSSFEERGDAFRRAVEHLQEGVD